MEEISNRTLAVLLVAAIMISLGGTILSLNRIMPKEMPMPTGPIPTGQASSDAGYINLSIAGGISITTADSNAINFGSCTPPGGSFTVINSEAGASICTSGDVGSTGSKNITVRNNGNVFVNVTMRATDAGKAQAGSFLPGATLTTSYIAFKPMATWAAGYGYGCKNNTALGYNSSWDANGHGWNSYQNITAGTNYTVCGNLTYSPVTSSSFGIAIMIGMPQDVSTGYNNLTLQFLGTNT
jgi:hypothetical protein